MVWIVKYLLAYFNFSLSFLNGKLNTDLKGADQAEYPGGQLPRPYLLDPLSNLSIFLKWAGLGSCLIRSFALEWRLVSSHRPQKWAQCSSWFPGVSHCSFLFYHIIFPSAFVVVVVLSACLFVFSSLRKFILIKTNFMVLFIIPFLI